MRASRYAVVASKTNDHTNTGGRLRYVQRVAAEYADRVPETSVDDGWQAPVHTTTTDRPAAALSLHEPQRRRTKNDGKLCPAGISVWTFSPEQMPGFRVSVTLV